MSQFLTSQTTTLGTVYGYLENYPQNRAEPVQVGKVWGTVAHCVSPSLATKFRVGS